MGVLLAAAVGILAELLAHHLKGTVDYTLPDGSTPHEQLPQVEVVVYLLDNVPGGRPDLFMIPGFDASELTTLGLAPHDPTTDPGIPPGGPVSAWPLTTNVLNRWESPSIWIDSEAGNGLVSNLSDEQDVLNHIDNAVFNALAGRLRYVRGQGDLFYQNAVNVVYVQIDNTGLGDSDAIPDGINLFALSSTGTRDLLGTWDLPTVQPNTTRRVALDLTPGALETAYLTQFGSQSWNVWTADLSVRLAFSADEKHTNNNFSTERIFVVQ